MVWVQLALMVISFLVTAFLAPKPKIENARSSNLDDQSLPRAAEGSPVPLIFGKVRLRGPNTLWFGDFQSIAVSKKIKTGLFSKKRVITGYKYYVGFALGLCLGSGIRLNRIWIDKEEVWSGSIGPSESSGSISKSGLFGGDEKGGGFVGNFKFYGGDFVQPRNSYLVSQLAPNETPAYVGLSYIVFEKPYIGTQPSLRPMTFELSRYTNDLGLTGGIHIINDDLNPAELLFQILTLPWGGLDIPQSEIDTNSFISAAQILAQEGNGMSLVISRANNGKDAIEEVLRQIDGVLYQDPTAGTIALKLIRQETLPDQLPTLGPGQIVSVRNFSRTSWEDTINQVRVVYTNRNNKYESSSAVVQDLANINAQGRLRSANMSFPGCTNGNLAISLATREMTQLSVPLFKATIEVNRTASTLRPGDAFILNWPEYNLEKVVMRVQRFNMGELIDGRVVIDCVQDEFATNQTVFSPPGQSLHQPINRTALPVSVASFIESPHWFMQKQSIATIPPSSSDKTYVLVFAKSPGIYQQGYSATIIQGTETVLAVDGVGFTNTAVLQTSITRLSGFSSGITTITITQVDGDASWLVSSTTSETRQGKNLFLMNSELFTFETVINNGNGTYTLGNVRRGLLDSLMADHNAGSFLFFFNVDALSESEWVGSSSMSAKIQTYTDKDQTDYNTAPTFNLLPARRYERPIPPDYVTLNGSRAPAAVTTTANQTVAWRARTRTRSDIAFEDDPADTAEAGTTYTMRVFLNGTLQPAQTKTGLTTQSTTTSFASGVSGTARVEVSAVLGGLESYTAGFIEFTVTTP